MRLWHCSFLSSKCWPCSGHSLNCHVFQLEQLTSWVFIREFNQYKGLIRRRNANIKRINSLIIHFHTVFSRMSCLSPLWALASSCWKSTKGTFTLEVQLLTPEEVQLSYLLLIFSQRLFFPGWGLESTQDGLELAILSGCTLAGQLQDVCGGGERECRVADCWELPKLVRKLSYLSLNSLLFQEVVCPWRGAVFIWKPARGI